jgi:alpha-tubulin suppressor-like RCC1 family protein
MRFLITALIPILAGALIAACELPASSKPDAPGKSQPVPQPNDIIYLGNKNTAGDVPQDTNKYQGRQEQAVALERGNLYRVGYCFTGWNTKEDGSGTAYPEKGPIDEKSYPLRLYAQWKKVFPRISAGENFSTLVTHDGKIYAAGDNAAGRLGVGNETAQTQFTEVKPDGTIPASVEMIISGTDHSFALLSNGGIAGWGRGDYGKLGINEDDKNRSSPTAPAFSGIAGVSSLGKVKHISVGRYQTALLTVEGEYWAAGTKYVGALGNGTSTGREKLFTKVTIGAKSVAAGWDYVLLVKNDGTMWVAGAGGEGRLGTGQTNNVTELSRNYAIDNNNDQVFAGKNNQSMVLKKDGNLLSAGNNTSGQLGHGDTTTRNYFAPVKDNKNREMTDVSFVSLGYNHSMILKKDGTLWAVGRNAESQFGAPQQVDYTNAVMVLDHVAHVAAGYNHTLAVKEDGTLWAAGLNSRGQLGRPGEGRNDKWTEVKLDYLNKPQTPTPPAAN